MINYFKKLLATLSSIDEQIKINNKHLKALSNCVEVNHHSHGDKHSISTKHWND